MNKILGNILIQPNVINKDGLKFLMDYVSDTPAIPTGVFSPERWREGKIPEKVDKTIRDAKSVDIDSIIPELRDLLGNVIYGLINPYYQFKIRDSEPPQLLRYDVGGHYKQHYDGVARWKNPDGSVMWKKSVDRDLSCVIFLNDDFEGGEFVFPDLRIRIRPEPGLMVCFPSTEYYLHKVEPVTKGIRYSLVTWMTVQGYKTLEEVDRELEEKYGIKIR